LPTLPRKGGGCLRDVLTSLVDTTQTKTQCRAAGRNAVIAAVALSTAAASIINLNGTILPLFPGLSKGAA
ncbi:hypothetical protein, partial [Bradyrhizobium elkanii]|uniref:hypothetical protein n=1 Tax=Bradyrhizobium elkanii TaxID=29448 RepID=UPI001AEDDCDC